MARRGREVRGEEEDGGSGGGKGGGGVGVENEVKRDCGGWRMEERGREGGFTSPEARSLEKGSTGG